MTWNALDNNKKVLVDAINLSIAKKIKFLSNR